MAMQTQKSPFLAKLGAKVDAAVKAHAKDPIEWGRMQLPAGIANGIARLTEIKIGDIFKSGTNKGQPYARLAGVVVEPRAVIVEGIEVPVEGQQTSMNIPLCDTKTQEGKVTTFDEHVGELMNELKKLGAEFAETSKGVDLEAAAAVLVEQGPHFRFTTSSRKARKPGDADGVWENWYGIKGVEDYVGETGGQVDDNSAATPPPAAAPPVKPGPAKAPPPKSPPVAAAAPAPQLPDDPDELVALANAGDLTGAGYKLRDLAITAGMSPEDFEAASFDDVGAFIKAGGAQAEYVPTVGDIIGCAIPDPKTKKPRAKKNVEVAAVDADKRTVSLKDGAVVFKGVSWDLLESPD